MKRNTHHVCVQFLASVVAAVWNAAAGAAHRDWCPDFVTDGAKEVFRDTTSV